MGERDGRDSAARTVQHSSRPEGIDTTPQNRIISLLIGPRSGDAMPRVAFSIHQIAWWLLILFLRHQLIHILVLGSLAA